MNVNRAFLDELAAVLRSYIESIDSRILHEHLCDDISDVCRNNIANYDVERFLKACGVELYSSPAALKLGTKTKVVPMSKVERTDLYGWDKIDADETSREAQIEREQAISIKCWEDVAKLLKE